MISVLCPSRGRPNLVTEVYNSILETVSCNSEVELIVAVDDDDPTIDQYRNQNWGTTKVIYGPRTSLGALYNRMWRISKGDILMISSDDMFFRTKNWDIIVNKEAKKYKDEIYYIHGFYDNRDNPPGFMYGFVSRKLTNIVGYVAPEFLNRFIDTYFESIGILLNRKFYVQIMVEHKHPDYGIRPRDRTIDELDQKYKNDKFMYEVTHYMREADANLLRSFINIYPIFI